MFAHGQIVVQILLVDPAKRAQKVACRGPQAFAGVGMDLPATIPLIIPRPFFLAMTHGVMGPLHLVVALPFIGRTSGVSFGVLMDVLRQRLAVGMGTDAQAPLPTMAPHSPNNGRPIIVVCSMPTLLVGAPPRGIKWSGVFLPFFPPRSETSHPFPCRDRATPWRLTFHSRWRGVACASARCTDARGRVPRLRPAPVRPCRLHALTTRPGVAPSYSPQRGCRYRGYTSAGRGDSDNPQRHACAYETCVRALVWRRSRDSSSLWSESISPPTQRFPAHQGVRLWGKSLSPFTTRCTE
jgi:hypothetical protein